jgi:hypothetical protein
MPDIGWDDFDMEAEDVSEEDAKAIDERPREGFLGRCVAVCIGSKPKLINFKEYNTTGITLEFEVEKVLELGVKQESEVGGDYTIVYEPAAPGATDQWAGTKLWDDVAMYHPDEKDGMAKRRKLVALRLGIIEPGQTLLKSSWQEDVIGQRVILKTFENRFIGKDGKEKIGRYPRIGGFDGYEHISTLEGQSGEEWGDI